MNGVAVLHERTSFGGLFREDDRAFRKVSKPAAAALRPQPKSRLKPTVAAEYFFYLQMEKSLRGPGPAIDAFMGQLVESGLRRLALRTEAAAETSLEGLPELPYVPSAPIVDRFIRESKSVYRGWLQQWLWMPTFTPESASASIQQAVIGALSMLVARHVRAEQGIVQLSDAHLEELKDLIGERLGVASFAKTTQGDAFATAILSDMLQRLVAGKLTLSCGWVASSQTGTFSVQRKASPLTARSTESGYRQAA